MSKFLQIDSYNPASTEYQLLPFRFTELDRDRYVLTNIAGEFIALPKEIIPKLINHELRAEEPAFRELRARHFLTDGSTSIAKDLLAIKVRSRYERQDGRAGNRHEKSWGNHIRAGGTLETTIGG